MLFDEDGEVQLFAKAGEDAKAKENRAKKLKEKLKKLNDIQLVVPSSKPLANVPRPDDEQAKKRAKEIRSLWEEYQVTIKQAWIRHEELLHKRAYRENPVKWENYQRHLIRLERLICAGQIGAKQIHDELNRIESAEKELKPTADATKWPAYNIPLSLRAKGDETSAETVTTAQSPGVASRSATGQTDASKADAAPSNNALPATTAATQGATTAAVQPAAPAAPGNSEKADAKTGEKPAEKAAPAVADNTAAKDSANGNPTASAAAAPVASKPEPNGKLAAAGEAKPPTDYFGTAQRLWDDSKKSLALKGLRDRLAEIPRPDKSLEADLVEIEFLRMLAAHVDEQTATEHAGDVRRAIEVRDLAESAAVPYELRSYYAIDALLKVADRQRRLAEDRLFVGRDEDLKDARDRWNKACGNSENGGYDEARKRAQEIKAAYEVRDRALAYLPHLVRWLCCRLVKSGDREKDATPDLRKLNELLAEARSFSDDLDKAIDAYRDNKEPNRDIWPGTLEKRRKDLSDEVENLKGLFDKECNHLNVPVVPTSMSASELRRLEAALDVPLLTGELRYTLRASYVARLAANSLGADAGAPKNLKSESPDRLADLTEHPAALLVRDETAPTNESTAKVATNTQEGPALRFASQGDYVRKERSKLYDWCKESKDKPASTIGTSFLDARASCAKAERIARRVAPLWAAIDDPDIDDPDVEPAGLLQRIDLRNLWLAQASRILADFWGPRPLGPDKRYYFDVVANSYLKAADLALPWPGDLADEIRARVKVADKGVTLTPPNNVYFDKKGPDHPRLPVKLDIEAAASLLNDGDKAAVFLSEGPEGSETPVITSSAGQTTASHRWDLGPEAAKAELPFNLVTVVDLKGGPTDSKTLFAETLYRGHQWRKPFHLVPQDGPEAIAVLPKPTKTTITVSGSATRKTSIIFILDCSGSMTTPDVPLKIEGGKSEGPGRQRIKVAKEKLLDIAEHLNVAGRSYRVGLLAYGNKYRWDKGLTVLGFREHIIDNVAGLLVKPANVKNEQIPDLDCSWVVPLADFDADQYKSIKSEIGKLQVGGQTPLYYSIEKAIDDFDDSRNNDGTTSGPKRIVVLTDGMNFQSLRAFRTSLKGLAEKLKEARAKMDLQLYVVSFRMSQFHDELKNVDNFTEEEIQEAFQEFEKFKVLVNKYGKYSASEDSSSLSELLEESIQRDQYIIQGPPPQRAVGPIDLNEPQELATPAVGIVPYDVKMRFGSSPPKTQVQIEGGEALKLQFQDSREPGGSGRLVHLEYPEEKDRKAVRAGATDIHGKPCQFKVFEVLRSNGTATFRISVQNKVVEEFSPRPKSVWVEIQPLADSEGNRKPIGSLYTFYDRCFVPDRPVPILEFDAAGWPAEAIYAEIRLWCKFEETDPDLTMAVSEIPGSPMVLTRDLALGAGPRDKTSMQLSLWSNEDKKPGNAYGVTVDQKFLTEAPLNCSKLEMLPPLGSLSPLPDEVRHRYLEQSRIVRHVFVFSSGQPPDLGRYRICITSRYKLLQDAIESPPMQVPVRRVDE